jgi:hypothetical protein
MSHDHKYTIADDAAVHVLTKCWVEERDRDAVKSS